MSFSDISSKKNQLIRKGLTGAVFLAPFASDAVTEATLFDTDTGDLQALPTGYVDLGYTTDSGVKLSESVTNSEVKSWGSINPTRVDITAKTTTMVVECQETKLVTIGLYTGQDITGITAGDNGAFSIQPDPNPTVRYYRALAVSVDTDQDGEFVIARFFPRAAVSDITDQTMADGDSPITWGVTLEAFVDSTLGYAEDYLIGGAGALALASDMSVPRTVTCTTATDDTLVATGGKFFASDVGKTVSGTGIFAASTIATWTDSTHVTLSHATTATATGVAVTVHA